MTLVFIVASMTSSAWLLSPRDISAMPEPLSLGGEKTLVRRKIEKRFYKTPFYERTTLIKTMLKTSSGFEKLLWRSFAPDWKDQVLSPADFRNRSPKGDEVSTNDFEVLSARLLYDYKRVDGPVYLPLLKRLLKVDPTNYRLLKVAFDSCFWVGTEGPNAAPSYAERAYASRLDDTDASRLMAECYYRRICYAVGKLDDLRSEYEKWSGKVLRISEASNTLEAAKDAKRIRSDRKFLDHLIVEYKNKGAQ